jgi:LPS O-antigen subunit length determinant protein (WzzB/FepE family)
MESPPAGYFLVIPTVDGEDKNDAIDLWKTAAILRSHWKLLLLMVFLGAGIAALISLQLRNVYRAQAVVAPTQENTGSNNPLKDTVGGIAELAGIDIGAGGGRKVEAMATLMSHGFVRDFILANNLMPILYAERWDANTKTWRKGAEPPTMEMMVKRFIGRRNVDENTKSGMVTLRFDWYSPELAAKWTNGMIDMVNERMRTVDVNTAEKSLEYLNLEMGSANGVELRMAISHLMETQVNNKMLANVQRDYAYHFIDRAVPPESKDGPKRTLITIGGAVIGLFLGMAYIALRRRAARISPP